MIRLGLIGYGYWGPLLARNFRAQPGMCLAAICDRDARRRTEAQAHCPGARTVERAEELLADPTIDALAIATPARSHFALACAALVAGKHVFVEKPLATAAEEAERLVEEAARRRLILMVDHTFLFAPAVERLAALVHAGELGELRYYDAVRIALGRFRSDVNVLWDLAVHDLAVLDRLVDQTPLAISAHGVAHLPGEPEDIAYVTVRFRGGLIANLHVNWLAPVKLRRTLVGGSRRTALWDDLEPADKLRVYDAGVTHEADTADEEQRHIGYRAGDVWLPRLDVREPLAAATAAFARAVETGRRPLADGESGLRVVRLLAAAQASLAREGAPTPLP